jgi:hypothetical protein
MSFRILFVIFCGLFFSAAALADDPALLIEKSRSPDGKIELWIVPEDGGAAAGQVQIREVKTEETVGKFDWFGFGVKADSESFNVFWRSDSRYFAIDWEVTRGWGTGAIYGRTKSGKWTEIKTPRDQYEDAIKRTAAINDFYGKGCDSPQRWTPEGYLELLFTDRNLFYPGMGDFQKEFAIKLEPSDKNGWPLATAKIISIRQKTEAEVEQDLYLAQHSTSANQ